MTLGNVLVACQRFADVAGVEPDVGCRLQQHGAVGEIGAFGKIEIH